MGLTCVQAKIYIALTHLGEASIGTVAKSTQTARQHLYEPLEKLEKTGLIKKIISNPPKYSVLPIENAVNTLMEIRNKENCELQNKATKLIKSLKEKQTTQQHQKETKTVSISGRKTFRRHSKEMLNNIQSSFDGLGNFKVFRRGFEGDSLSFIKALNRGVSFRHIISEPISEQTILGDENLREKPLWQVRIAPKPTPCNIFIFDKQTVVISATLNMIKDYSFYKSNCASFLCLAQTYFDMLWDNSAEIKI